MVYTINAIESLNARFRQATRVDRANVTGKTGAWKAALNAVAPYYDRITGSQRRSPPTHEITTGPLLHRRLGHDTG